MEQENSGARSKGATRTPSRWGNSLPAATRNGMSVIDEDAWPPQREATPQRVTATAREMVIARGDDQRSKESGRRDSNSRHPAWEASALPLSYARR